MTTQITTTTEETVAPSGPSMVPPEIPPWNPPSGSRLERRRSFEVQSPRPEHINPLPPSSDPFAFFGSSDSKKKDFTSVEEDPQSHLHRQQDIWDVRHEPQYVPLLNHRTMVTTMKVVTIEEVEEEATLLTPLTHRILLVLPVHQVAPELHAGLFKLHLTRRLLEQPIKKEETDPMPSQRNPSSKISHSSSSYSFSQTIHSIL